MNNTLREKVRYFPTDLTNEMINLIIPMASKVTMPRKTKKRIFMEFEILVRGVDVVGVYDCLAFVEGV